MQRNVCFILLCLALASASSAAALATIADLQGTWKGHCLQYATASANGVLSCIPYKATPLRSSYNVTYSDSTVSYYDGNSPVESGSLTNVTKYKAYACVNILFAYGPTSYTVDIKTANGVKTYTEEGVFTVPDGYPTASCLLKEALIGARLYCDAKRFNYICTATYLSA